MNYVLITGASQGIGYNLALKYASLGYNLILISRNIDKLNELRNKINTDCIIIRYDLSKNLDDLFKKLSNLSKEIEIVINNAGFGIVNKFIDTNINRNNELIDLNVKALTNITYYFLNNSNAKICNISSIASIYPGYNMSLYYASKAYVTSFSRGISKEKNNRNRICVINLPKINTNFDKNAGERKHVSKGKNVNYAVEKIMKAINGKRCVYNVGFSTKITIFTSKLFHRSFLLNISKKTNEI